MSTVHCDGWQTFKAKNQKALFEALLKVKEGIDLFSFSVVQPFSGDVLQKLRFMRSYHCQKTGSFVHLQ